MNEHERNRFEESLVAYAAAFGAAVGSGLAAAAGAVVGEYAIAVYLAAQCTAFTAAMGAVAWRYNRGRK